MFLLKRALACSAAVAAIPAFAQQPADPAAAFGARESVQSMMISPNGRTIAFIGAADHGSQVLQTVEVANPVPHAAGRSDRNQRLNGCSFINDERLVCSLTSIVELQGEMVPLTQLIAVNKDGSDLRNVGERNSHNQLYARLWSGRIIDHAGGAPNSVLMEQLFVPEQGAGTILNRTQEGLGVVRMDTRTLRSTTVEAPRNAAEQYISDGRGHVRLLAVREYLGTGQVTARTKYMYRRAPDADWEDFGTYDDDAREGVRPVAVDPDLNAAYAYAKLDGRVALYRIALDGSMRRELVASNDRVDIDSLIRFGRTGRVVGASYATARRHAVYFQPELQQIVERLHRALPDKATIDIVDGTLDETKLLILAASDNDPGQFYFYDRSTRQLTPVLAVRPELSGVRRAHVRPITYRAQDGTQIPGYLTLPAGSSGRGLPAIVLPHGGPSARDEWGFDWLAQYYANRGYAVLQPNYRGSAGYGDEWFRENGFRSWRTAISDVNDAGRWLVSEGIADPSKLAIVGWSYGGYAALQSNVVDQNLFKAIVAVAPVTDLALARDSARRTSAYRLVRDFFGTGPHIAEGSPAQNAAAIRAPVLMFHGTRDLNVAVAQSRLMEERLRSAGRPVELVVYPDLDHQLDDSAARTDMLRRSDEFLRRALSIGTAAAPTSNAAGTR